MKLLKFWQNMSRRLKIVVVSLLSFIVIVFVVIPLTLGYILKASIEAVAPKALQADVKLTSMNVSLLSGRGTLRGLSVANPKGFKNPLAINVGYASIKLKPTSLLQDIIVVEHVYLKRPEITYETNKNGNNIKVLQRNAETFARSLVGEATKDKGGEAGTKKIMIYKFVIQDAQVKWSPRLMNGKTIDMKLPDIELENLGVDENGISTTSLFGKVLGSLSREIGKAVARNSKNLFSAPKKGVKKIGDGLKKLFGDGKS